MQKRDKNETFLHRRYLILFQLFYLSKCNYKIHSIFHIATGNGYTALYIHGGPKNGATDL